MGLCAPTLPIVPLLSNWTVLVKASSNSTDLPYNKSQSMQKLEEGCSEWELSQ
jgi:hypothetical protein